MKKSTSFQKESMAFHIAKLYYVNNLLPIISSV